MAAEFFRAHPVLRGVAAVVAAATSPLWIIPAIAAAIIFCFVRHFWELLGGEAKDEGGW